MAAQPWNGRLMAKVTSHYVINKSSFVAKFSVPCIFSFFYTYNVDHNGGIALERSHQCQNSTY
jgi:hypothetical protein